MQGSRRGWWVLRQCAVVLLGVVVYFGVRGRTEGRPRLAVQHADDVLAWEQRFGLAREHELQQLVVGHAWRTDLANWVYVWGHWPVIATVLLWLALRHRDDFLRLRDALLASGAVGLVIFALYPVAPPRLADLGLVDTVSEYSEAYRVLQPPAFVNQYAAMPSLHVGWDLLVGITVVVVSRRWWLRAVGVLLPVAMMLAVVTTANHFVVDGAVGSALALVGLQLARLLERRRHSAPGSAPPPARAASPRVPRPRSAAEGAGSSLRPRTG